MRTSSKRVSSVSILSYQVAAASPTPAGHRRGEDAWVDNAAALEKRPSHDAFTIAPPVITRAPVDLTLPNVGTPIGSRLTVPACRYWEACKSCTVNVMSLMPIGAASTIKLNGLIPRTVPERSSRRTPTRPSSRTATAVPHFPLYAAAFKFTSCTRVPMVGVPVAIFIAIRDVEDPPHHAPEPLLEHPRSTQAIFNNACTAVLNAAPNSPKCMRD